jgi:hypothetical protein
MRSYVTFRSARFNTAEDREIFLRPGHFGDDVAAWFADRLTENGWDVEEEITQEPLGWFVTFSKNGEEFDLGVSCLNPERGVWLAWLEQPAGFFTHLFGKRNRAIADSGPRAIHAILENAPEVEGICWHTRDQFVRGEIEEGSEAPETDPEADPATAAKGYLS